MKSESVAYIGGLITAALAVRVLNWGWGYLAYIALFLVFADVAWPRFKRWLNKD